MGVILDTGGPGWRLVVWSSTGLGREAGRIATPADLESVAEFSSGERRAGRLAARAALRVILPEAVVGYDSYGAPYLVSTGPHGRSDWAVPSPHTPGEEAGHLSEDPSGPVTEVRGEGTGLQVSFSHCLGAAAAIVADCACAVDIERADRNFERAAPRFVSAPERTVAGSGSGLFLPAVWCAKETLYKYARTPGTDFLRDIEIHSFDPEAGVITARLGEREGIRVVVRTLGGYILCHIPGVVFGSVTDGGENK